MDTVDWTLKGLEITQFSLFPDKISGGQWLTTSCFGRTADGEDVIVQLPKNLHIVSNNTWANRLLEEANRIKRLDLSDRLLELRIYRNTERLEDIHA